MTIEHVDAPLGEIHAPHNWEFADAAARAAANITDPTLEKRLALQLDDMSLWLLASVSPLTWAPIGGGGSGTPGADGKSVLSGTGAPGAGVGTNGDFYIDTTAWDIYGPKNAGAWGSPTSLIGPQGVQGIQGNPGVDGKTIRYGTGAPSNALGVDGDFYIATDTNFMYGPKASGAWPAGFSLVGPQGPQGAPGAGGSMTIKDEGTTITSTPGSMDFVGAGVTSTQTGGAVTVTIPGAPVTDVAGKTGSVSLVKADVGLGNVDNTSDANKPISSATQTALNGKESTIASGTLSQFWRGDKAFVALTKSDVGLSNVDNTSDANKPVSTAQAAADAATLASAKSYADGLVVGLWDDRGNYDASGNVFPSSGGSGSSGTVLKGDIWTISVSGTLGGTAVVPQQTVRAVVDTPGQTAGNWAISIAGTANIDDAINDGVVGRAPSQNAVFDALALKEPAFAAGTTAQYRRGDKTWADFATDVRAAVLTGLSTATNAVAAATDTVLQAIGKLQAQLNAIRGVTGLVKSNGSGTISAAAAATDYVAPSAYASVNGLTMATARLLGRTTAGGGAAEEISIGSGLTLSGGSLSASGGSGTVTSVSVVSANGFGGSVATASSTPAITITTGVTGLLKGNGTGVSAAVAGVDYSAAVLTLSSQSAAYTLVLGDANGGILHPSSDTTARTFTIPANSSVAYPIGTSLTFINQNSAGTVTIAINTDTMRLAGAGTTGSRTLTANGIATAIKVTSTEWLISGTNLS
jgi:hypothetical protein